MIIDSVTVQLEVVDMSPPDGSAASVRSSNSSLTKSPATADFNNFSDFSDFDVTDLNALEGSFHFKKRLSGSGEKIYAGSKTIQDHFDRSLSSYGHQFHTSEGQLEAEGQLDTKCQLEGEGQQHNEGQLGTEGKLFSGLLTQQLCEGQANVASKSQPVCELNQQVVLMRNGQFVCEPDSQPVIMPNGEVVYRPDSRFNITPNGMFAFRPDGQPIRLPVSQPIGRSNGNQSTIQSGKPIMTHGQAIGMQNGQPNILLNGQVIGEPSNHPVMSSSGQCHQSIPRNFTNQAASYQTSSAHPLQVGHQNMWLPDYNSLHISGGPYQLSDMARSNMAYRNNVASGPHNNTDSKSRQSMLALLFDEGDILERNVDPFRPVEGGSSVEENTNQGKISESCNSPLMAGKQLNLNIIPFDGIYCNTFPDSPKMRDAKFQESLGDFDHGCQSKASYSKSTLGLDYQRPASGRKMISDLCRNRSVLGQSQRNGSFEDQVDKVNTGHILTMQSNTMSDLQGKQLSMQHEDKRLRSISGTLLDEDDDSPSQKFGNVCKEQEIRSWGYSGDMRLSWNAMGCMPLSQNISSQFQRGRSALEATSDEDYLNEHSSNLQHWIPLRMGIEAKTMADHLGEQRQPVNLQLDYVDKSNLGCEVASTNSARDMERMAFIDLPREAMELNGVETRQPKRKPKSSMAVKTTEKPSMGRGRGKRKLSETSLGRENGTSPELRVEICGSGDFGNGRGKRKANDVSFEERDTSLESRLEIFRQNNLRELESNREKKMRSEISDVQERGNSAELWVKIPNQKFREEGDVSERSRYRLDTSPISDSSPLESSCGKPQGDFLDDAMLIKQQGQEIAQEQYDLHQQHQYEQYQKLLQQQHQQGWNVPQGFNPWDAKKHDQQHLQQQSSCLPPGFDPCVAENRGKQQYNQQPIQYQQQLQNQLLKNQHLQNQHQQNQYQLLEMKLQMKHVWELGQQKHRQSWEVELQMLQLQQQLSMNPQQKQFHQLLHDAQQKYIQLQQQLRELENHHKQLSEQLSSQQVWQ